jgi:2-C-methyl-D-erythritol 2,4-cyclodiphosphate synthase
MSKVTSSLRIGKGYDVHALVNDRPLIIGGVTIAFDKGLAGHSDADVLMHAICDALLGAANLGDIGQHFSPDDAQHKSRESKYFLQQVSALLAQNDFGIVNIDSTIIAQAPKMASYLPAMKVNIAAALSIHIDLISIKATSTEKLGFIGRGEGIAADAIVLLEKIKP